MRRNGFPRRAWGIAGVAFGRTLVFRAASVGNCVRQKHGGHALRVAGVGPWMRVGSREGAGRWIRVGGVGKRALWRGVAWRGVRFAWQAWGIVAVEGAASHVDIDPDKG